MAKAGRKPKRDTRGPLQRAVDADQARAEQSNLDVITPEQRAKGTYVGERRIVNAGGTPIMRWIAADKISDTQALAIQTCYRLWALVGTERRTTASYGERIASSLDHEDRMATTKIEAREDLYRIQEYVPKAWWQVFENVCRFDEPAGVAGSRLGFGSRSAQDRAHTVVCMVADIIAMNERLIPVSYIRVA